MNMANIFLKPEHSKMPTKEELKKYLRKEEEYAILLKVTGKGIHYIAQLLYPGERNLLVVNFLVPLDAIKSATFEGTVPAKRLINYIVL